MRLLRTLRLHRQPAPELAAAERRRLAALLEG